MKNMILLALVILLLSSISYAQPASAPKVAAPAAVQTVITKKVIGKIKAITVADPAQGRKSEITVVDENSLEKVFVVKSTATIYDADFKAVSLDKIKTDDKVKVKYITTKEGVYEAVSLNLLK